MAGLMVSSIGAGQLIARTGKYKLPAIAGVALASVAMLGFTSLTPSSSYVHEAILMVLVGLGFGVMMPIINLIVQSEFSIKQLGAATSSSQLFRGLGSTLGVAVFGAMLTGAFQASWVLFKARILRRLLQVQSLRRWVTCEIQALLCC